MKARAILLPTDVVLTPAETRIAVGYMEGYIGKEIADRNHVSYNISDPAYAKHLQQDRHMKDHKRFSRVVSGEKL